MKKKDYHLHKATPSRLRGSSFAYFIETESQQNEEIYLKKKTKTSKPRQNLRKDLNDMEISNLSDKEFK